MKIRDILTNKKITISCELFPPKADADFDPILQATEEIAALKPDFMSVTYGAGGGTSRTTVKMAAHIQNDLQVSALAHLTCVSSSKEEVRRQIAMLKEQGLENILALRGDIPTGREFPQAGYYKYAYQLIEEIKETGDFCVGGACYPEGHVECGSKDADMDYLKQKADSGCDFLTTQMFFDNNMLYNFLYRALKKNINIPIIAGVMPVTSASQIKRICSLSGATLTPKFKMIADKFGEDPKAMKQAGIAYATDQIVDLIANGVTAVHIYTMNKPDVAKGIMENLSEIWRG